MSEDLFPDLGIYLWDCIGMRSTQTVVLMNVDWRNVCVLDDHLQLNGVIALDEMKFWVTLATKQPLEKVKHILTTGGLAVVATGFLQAEEMVSVPAGEACRMVDGEVSLITPHAEARA